MATELAKGLALSVQIVSTLIGYVLGMAGIFYLLTQWFGLPAWLIGLGAIVGFVIAMIRIVLLVGKNEKSRSNPQH